MGGADGTEGLGMSAREDVPDEALHCSGCHPQLASLGIIVPSSQSRATIVQKIPVGLHGGVLHPIGVGCVDVPFTAVSSQCLFAITFESSPIYPVPRTPFPLWNFINASFVIMPKYPVGFVLRYPFLISSVCKADTSLPREPKPKLLVNFVHTADNLGE